MHIQYAIERGHRLLCSLCQAIGNINFRNRCTLCSWYFHCSITSSQPNIVSIVCFFSFRSSFIVNLRVERLSLTYCRITRQVSNYKSIRDGQCETSDQFVGTIQPRLKVRTAIHLAYYMSVIFQTRSHHICGFVLRRTTSDVSG